MTKLLKTSAWEANEKEYPASHCSSHFGVVAEKPRENCTRKETRAFPSLLELERLLVDYGRTDMLINKLRSIHHLLFCRCTSELY